MMEESKSPEEKAAGRIQRSLLAKELDLSSLNLTFLPPEIGNLTNLTSLDLSDNKLVDLPPEIGQLTNLTLLNLTRNQLASLPPQIGKLTKLESFNLSDNQITRLPLEIGQLFELTSLDLSVNKLSNLPPEIGSLSQLIMLSLRANEVAKLPTEIWQLSQLMFLDLSGNNLEDLPLEIGQLKNLNTLLVSFTHIVSLPPEIGELPNLVKLYVSHNQITSLPREIGNLVKLQDINLSENRLTSLPPEFWKLTTLTLLNLSSNQLTSLSREIGQLTQLTSLYIPNNKIAYLPSEIANLTNLTHLIIFNNQLVSLPSEIGLLHKLTELNLSHNQITYLPKEIEKLSDLISLDISDNQITSLPPEVGKLSMLGNLCVGNNQIARLPPEICQLTKLTLLDLHGNQLTDLPSSLQKLPNLFERFDLRGNPLSIPPEILDKAEEPREIFNYLNWVWGGKRQPLSETKMLVVGQGSVGKTSLIRRLTDDAFSSSEIKTDGIAINRWQVVNTKTSDTKTGENQPETLRVNIWDFGGQEIMHATHQFFLTRRSLYLLVLDSRISQEENRVEYWLKIIQSFGGDSPVLLIGNKIDQHPLDIDRTGLQKKYPNIFGILETSAASGAGLEELKSAITEQVNALPHVRDSIPEAWFNVKAQLEELGHEQNYISQERYEEKCAELEVKDELSQRTLIGFLHDLGIVLHFQDDPRLEALGILNPQWVTNGVYKILNAHALFQNKGVLERSMLADILPEDDYPANKRLFIVDMMRKFELCYDIVPEQTFLVPDLLPKDEPFTGEWDGALAFQYHYNILPSSIVSRFIVRMNAYIHKTVWRAGVVLQKDGNTALVKADTEERKIYIWVNGAENTRRDFLSVIRAEFDAIHKTIIKIEAVQKVPHPEYPDLVLDYAELLQFERDNIAEFPRSVDGKTVMVNVRQLLNGVRVGSESAPVVKSVAPPAVESVKVETAPVHPAAGNQSPLVRILSAVFVSLPRIIGRFALDIFGRGKDSADSTSVLLGYVLIVLSALVVWGIVDVNSLRDWFAGWWRFFFPVKP